MPKNRLNDYNNSNIDDVTLTDTDYSGVIYEPSSKKTYRNIKKNNSKSTNKKKIKKAQNFNYSYFLTGSILLGTVICIVVVFLTYNLISDYLPISPSIPNVNNNTSNISNTPKIDETVPLNSNTNKVLTGIIKEMPTETNIIQILEPISNKTYALKIIGSTELRNEFNSPLSIIEFSRGDIIDFSFDSTNKVISMKISPVSFYEENISNYTLDLDNSLLKIDNKSYILDKNSLVYKDILELSIQDINPLDTLDIKGFNNTIYYIQIKKGHGTLKFINKPELPNATLEVDRDIFKQLSEIDTLTLREGTHKLVIRENSITPFVKEIKINSSKETVIDLSEIQSKKGTLLIKVNVPDYNLYINNIQEPSREPLSISYGVYTIRIQKEEYEPFETQISINKPQTSIQVDLEKIEQLGKLSINSNPTEAQVFVDNVFVGYTPLDYKLKYGNHNIVLKKSDYLDFNLSSVVIGKNDSTFNITMHKSTSSTTITETTTENITTTELITSN